MVDTNVETFADTSSVEMPAEQEQVMLGEQFESAETTIEVSSVQFDASSVAVEAEQLSISSEQKQIEQPQQSVIVEEQEPELLTTAALSKAVDLEQLFANL